MSKKKYNSFMTTAPDKWVIFRMIISTPNCRDQGCFNFTHSGKLSCSWIANCTCKFFVTEHWKVNEGKPGRQLLSENIWINSTPSELSFPSKAENCFNQKHDSTVKFSLYTNLKQPRPWDAGHSVSHKPIRKWQRNVIMNYITEDHLRAMSIRNRTCSYAEIFSHFYNVRKN